MVPPRARCFSDGLLSRLAALAVALTMTLACGARVDAPLPRPSLILISIDTLRADRLGVYGYARDTSPTLDALAARGVRFETVIAESNWTLPSHMTLFTGMPPSIHGVTEPSHKLQAGVRTLAVVLQEHGYRTFGIHGGGFVDVQFGFGRGFERYGLHPVSFRLGLDTAARKIANLDPQQPFFWFIHTYDVHCPYEPSAEYAARFETRGPEDQVETQGRCGERDFNSEDLTPGQALFLSDRYDASIREADDRLGEFLTRLRETGRLDDTFVAVLSDHGEEFLEHGQIGHRDTQFIESLRVPWVVVGPGLEPAVAGRPAGLADVMPTLLDLLGIPIPPKVRGESLVPMIQARNAGVEPVDRFSENPPKALYSLVRGDRHLILRRRDDEFLLFDWRADPRETENRMGWDPEADAELVETLERRIQRMAVTRHRLRPARALEVDADKRKRLRALGYLE